MYSPRSLVAGTALSWALLAPAAYADLTAAQVWEDWRSYMQGMGYVVTADESSDGNQLAVSNINVGMKQVDDSGSMNMSIGTLTFVEQGDGSVEMVMPAVLPMSVTVTPEKGRKPATFDLSINQSGQNVIVRGTPDDLVYDYSADTMTVRMDQLTVDGESFGPDRARVSMSLQDFTSTTAVKVGALRTYDQKFQSGAIEFDLFMDPPDEDSTVAIKGRSDSLKYSGTSAIPEKMMDATDMNAMLDAGFAFDAAFDLGAGSSETNVVSPDGPSAFKTTTGSSMLMAKMAADGITYSGKQTDVSIEGQIANLPFPVMLSMEESGFGVTVPVKKSNDPQNFAMNFNLTDFTMSDMIWGIFDPQSQLPRDPATLVVDISGKTKMLINFLAPDATEKKQPAEIEELSINMLRLDAIGAELTGQGEMDFDNTDKVTIPGMPKPTGQITFALKGANGLLDKLVAMGLIPQEQAMGARMMMNIFAVPDEGEDSLKSKIEFTEDGQVLANGQRIK